MTGIEWRVTARGLEPRYFHGKRGRLQAHQYATARTHLGAVTWWRHNHGTGTSPWIDLADRDPNHTPTTEVTP